MGVLNWLLDKINKRERQRRILGTNKPQAGIAEKAAESVARHIIGDSQETNPTCPHCGFMFDAMPKARRKCPDCKEWICVSKPPGMKNARLVSDEKAREWRLKKAIDEQRYVGDGGHAYALELARQGLPFHSALHDAHRHKLLEYQSEGIKAVSVNPAPDCCPECRKVSKKRVGVSDELLNQRLPCRECTAPLYRKPSVTGWCRCDYVPH